MDIKVATYLVKCFTSNTAKNFIIDSLKAVAIYTNLLVALKAMDLLLTPIQLCHQRLFTWRYDNCTGISAHVS